MPPKRKGIEEDTANDETVFRSAPIDDRSSRFIGYFSPTLKPKELQNLPEIESASHRILGWRRESNQQSITKAIQYVTGSDDDGEKYGGSKIEKVLASMKVSGACVVARWYGGVMLGPVRFTHMETAAREAVTHWQMHEAEQRTKKRKLQEDADDHARLSKTLTARDESIAVLRALAAEKEDAMKRASSPAVDGSQTSNAATASQPAVQQVPTDYESMTLERLRMLEKARDATIAFLLKRIDKAEAETASKGCG